MANSISRRDLLGSASAVVMAGLAGRALAQDGRTPPVATVRPVTDTLHGVQVTDPYRWMETPTDPEWKPYLMGQNAYARRVLGSLSGRDALAARIGSLTGKVVAVTSVQAAGPYIFTELRPAGANTFKLYVRDGVGGTDRLLIDPDREATAGTHYSLDYWQASPDGAMVAYGISPAGSENSVLRFVETKTGRMPPDALDRAQFGAVSWLPDGSGVFLNRLKAGTKHGDPDHYLDSVDWLHRLGSDPAGDVEVMARGLDAAIKMQDIASPTVAAQAGESYVLGVPQNGVQNEFDLYVAPLASAVAGRPQWTQVCRSADNVTGVTLFRGGHLPAESRRGAALQGPQDQRRPPVVVPGPYDHRRRFERSEVDLGGARWALPFRAGRWPRRGDPAASPTGPRPASACLSRARSRASTPIRCRTAAGSRWTAGCGRRWCATAAPTARCWSPTSRLRRPSTSRRTRAAR